MLFAICIFWVTLHSIASFEQSTKRTSIISLQEIDPFHSSALLTFNCSVLNGWNTSEGIKPHCFIHIGKSVMMSRSQLALEIQYLSNKLSISIKTSTCQTKKVVLHSLLLNCMSGEISTNYTLSQICLFNTTSKLRSLSYCEVVVYTILDPTKWQVATEICNSACSAWSPQLCCQSVKDGCK